MMRLNSLAPAPGSKFKGKRLGRGTGSGFGKTGGRGHKGQHSRSGGYKKVGFEGGQMPLARRLPKRGFASRIGRFSVEVRLSELNKIEGAEITPEILKSSGVINRNAVSIKIILSGKIQKKFTFKGVKITKGARVAIDKIGGSIEGN